MSSFFPHAHLSKECICGKGSRSLRIVVVRKAVGENRKKRFVRDGKISAFDELGFSKDGKMVVKRLSVGWFKVEIVSSSMEDVINLDKPFSGSSEIM